MIVSVLTVISVYYQTIITDYVIISLMPDTTSLIQSFGYIGMFLIIVAQTGLFVPFFLPGNTLPLVAGMFASYGWLSIEWLIIVCVLGSIVGSSIGYAIGSKKGKKLFTSRDGFLFNPKHLQNVEDFYEKHGKVTVIFGRFFSVVRTFTAPIAGISKLELKEFSIFNAVGAILWGAGLSLLGYWLGGFVAQSTVEKAILPFMIVATIFTVGSLAYHTKKHDINPKLIDKS